MRLIVTVNATPFLTGGATYHFEGLVEALRARGHEVETLRFPFTFHPEASIERLMDWCETLDLAAPNGQHVDRVISLQFPGYGVNHPHHTVWVMHQHRAVYDLYPGDEASPEVRRLRGLVHAYDNRVLARAERLFANSRNVSARLFRFNGIAAEALYHPPPLAAHFRCDEARDYVFLPSRMEALKRQGLVLEAAKLWRAPVICVLAGRGGLLEQNRRFVAENDLGERAVILEDCPDAEKLALYAGCLGVIYPPRDEDYGYVTLEAQLAAKPVVTCTDSGGPLEFVEDGAEGFVVEPTAQGIADAVDRLWNDRARAREMGRLGLARYLERNISWDNVVARLTE
ncbi:MAG: glycosyltransferase family 4 protein [Pseudochelatococcus sp.]|jgi:glycosyltransferase involved in cell wall biosynthesis|uniref:glycosyltransferase family 4 protein n=1 Tax=Pseudochelatococcus sp. TaxID=2020869 RepID=UPI003D8EB5FF